MVYEEGSFYEGNFKNDMMNGSGILYYEEGKPAYDGNWLDDQFHGKGVLYNLLILLSLVFQFSLFSLVFLIFFSVIINIVSYFRLYDLKNLFITLLLSHFVQIQLIIGYSL